MSSHPLTHPVPITVPSEAHPSGVSPVPDTFHDRIDEGFGHTPHVEASLQLQPGKGGVGLGWVAGPACHVHERGGPHQPLSQVGRNCVPGQQAAVDHEHIQRREYNEIPSLGLRSHETGSAPFWDCIWAPLSPSGVGSHLRPPTGTGIQELCGTVPWGQKGSNGAAPKRDGQTTSSAACTPLGRGQSCPEAACAHGTMTEHRQKTLGVCKPKRTAIGLQNEMHR